MLKITNNNAPGTLSFVTSNNGGPGRGTYYRTRHTYLVYEVYLITIFGVGCRTENNRFRFSSSQPLAWLHRGIPHSQNFLAVPLTLYSRAFFFFFFLRVLRPPHQSPLTHRRGAISSNLAAHIEAQDCGFSVSYTHLTLPTKA